VGKTYFDYFGGETAGSPDGPGEVGSPAPQAEAPAPSLRVSQRIAIGMRAKVQNKAGLEEFAITRNVSNRGVCFVSSKPFNLNEEIRVELYFDHNRHVGPLPRRIVRSLPASATWQHGVAWSERANLGLATVPPAPHPDRPHGTGWWSTPSMAKEKPASHQLRLPPRIPATHNGNSCYYLWTGDSVIKPATSGEE
jgi:hypothetical protein